MSIFGDPEEYLDAKILERIFGSYKDLYDLAVKDITDYKSQDIDRDHDNIAGSFSYRYDRLYDWNNTFLCSIPGL